MRSLKVKRLSPSIASAISAAIASILNGTPTPTPASSVAVITTTATPAASVHVTPRSLSNNNCSQPSNSDDHQRRETTELRFENCSSASAIFKSSTWLATASITLKKSSLFSTSTETSKHHSTTSNVGNTALEGTSSNLANLAAKASETPSEKQSAITGEDIENSAKLTLIVLAISLIVAFIVFSGGLFYIGYHPKDEDEENKDVDDGASIEYNDV